jgi:hypothetical protein
MAAGIIHGGPTSRVEPENIADSRRRVSRMLSGANASRARLATRGSRPGRPFLPSPLSSLDEALNATRGFTPLAGLIMDAYGAEDDAHDGPEPLAVLRSSSPQPVSPQRPEPKRPAERPAQPRQKPQPDDPVSQTEIPARHLAGQTAKLPPQAAASRPARSFTSALKSVALRNRQGGEPQGARRRSRTSTAAVYSAGRDGLFAD